MQSQYAKRVPAILAEMEKGREEDERADHQEETGEPEVIHVYPLEGGGLVFTKTPIEDEPEAPIVDSMEPETDQRSPRKDPPYFLYFLLILLLFLGLDSADTALIALFTPTVNVTIIPQTKTVRTTATLPLSSVKGRVLPALTLTQSLTVPATGHGHQTARSATGTLTCYNGSFSPQLIYAGTLYTGIDGVQVVTDQTVTIPPASPGSPPQFGVATVSAHAVLVGSMGNIQADDITITAHSVLVQNSQFSGGQNERDFIYVTKGDLQHAINALTPELLQSQQAALQSQLRPGEALVSPTCTKTETADHLPGDETSQVKVTVSETCSAILYNKDTLQTQAISILNNLAAKKLGTGYRLFGSIQATVTQAAHTPSTLVLSLSGVWVFQINEESIKNLVAGKPRLEAIRLLSLMPGVAHVTIAGIEDNKPLPDDVSHIRLLILVGLS